MEKNFKSVLKGYQSFRDKYAHGDQSVMQYLSRYGQKPKIMVIACCDSRVDPALILQCDPGDLFVVRNVANIVPPYEKDIMHHGTSAALEFAVCFLEVKSLILLGHSQCGGIKAVSKNQDSSKKDDFITNWVSIIKTDKFSKKNVNYNAKLGLTESYKNCMMFPWIKERVLAKKLIIHLWFFDIKSGLLFRYSNSKKKYEPLQS